MNENEVPELIENYNNPMNGSDSDDEEFDAEEELMDFCQDPCKDLFSDEFFKTPSECLKHCKSQYDFDLLVRKNSFRNNFRIITKSYQQKKIFFFRN